MPGKDTFYVNNKYLKNANYTLALGSDTYIAAYQERIVAGPVELCPNSGDARFTKKAVIIPSNVYFAFTNSVRKGLEAFENDDQTPFEDILYKYSKVHHVVAKYERWENGTDDEDFKFKLNVKWNFKSDRSWNRMVEMGLKDTIDTSNYNGNWIWLKRNATFSKDQLEMVHAHLGTILEYSFYEQDSKVLVLNFIEYVLSSPKLRQYVSEKLETYETLTYPAKMKILKYLVASMFEERKPLENEGSDYGQKTLMDSLSNKVILTFSLFNHRINQ